MTSEAQIAANRANAEKSTGPKTLEGKEKSRKNATRHGLRAERLMALGEDSREFNVFYASMAHALLPQDTYEAALVRRLAVIAWRLERIGRIEAGLFNDLLERNVRFDRPEGDLVPHQIPTLGRYETGLDRGFQRAMTLLERRQELRRRRERKAHSEARDEIGSPSRPLLMPGDAIPQK